MANKPSLLKIRKRKGVNYLADSFGNIIFKRIGITQIEWVKQYNDRIIKKLARDEYTEKATKK